MSSRVGNPFPNASWSPEAYQNASYLSVTMGNEFDVTTGNITVLPRFGETTEPLTGSPGQILSSEAVIEGVGTVPTEESRINMAFIMGYMYAQLEGLKANG